MTEKKEIQAIQHLDHTPLMSNHQTVSFQPNKMLIDFKGIYPQFTPDNVPQIVVTHKNVILDPYVAKKFSETLEKNIKNYEKQYGKIKIPKALEKAKKDSKAKKKKDEEVIIKPTYMG